MKKLLCLYNKYSTPILYIFFGILTTLINVLIYFILSKINLNNIVFNTSISWLICVIFAYITNKLFVFKSKRTNLYYFLKEFIYFFISRFFSGFLDVFIMYLFVSILSFNNMIIKIISNVIIIILNFILSKLIIFKK